MSKLTVRRENCGVANGAATQKNWGYLGRFWRKKKIKRKKKKEKKMKKKEKEEKKKKALIKMFIMTKG